MREMTTREIQLICLDILKDMHDFCVKNNIKYSLSGGTLLGAVRHNGFIPWDDDADIQMPRPDYDKFARTYQSKHGYKVFTCEVDGYEKTRLRLGRIHDMDRTYMDCGPRRWTEETLGIGIDIEPCDGAPDTKEEALAHFAELKRLTKLNNVERSRYIPFGEIRKFKSFKEGTKFAIQKIVSYLIPRRNRLEKLVECQKKYDWNTSKYFMASIHYGIGEWQPKENMRDYILHDFEDTQLFIMIGYDANLRSLYGDNYMEIPPPSKRKIPHSHALYYWRDEKDNHS